MFKCIGKTTTGKQCTRNAKEDGCCWQHKGLYTLTSIDIKECSNGGSLDLIQHNKYLSDMKRRSNSGMKNFHQFNSFITSGGNLEEYIDYGPIRVPMLSRPKEVYVNPYNLTYFPFLSITNDAQYELIYQMNVRNACRLFRTCKLLYLFWVSKHEPSVENNQMWFSLCVLNNLSGSIDLSKKFVDWKACCITRYRRSIECANCHYVHTGTQVHPRGICIQFIKTAFIDYK
jgi:hypothetical protein